MKPYTLVLGGGAARGVYQAGVLKVLHRLGYKYNAIVGTSVGALNGALVAQGDLEKCIHLWENVKLKDVVDLPEELLEDGQFRITRRNLPFLHKYRKWVVKNGGLDTTPLRKTITRVLDEKRIRASRIDFGLVTYEIKSLRPLEMFLDRIPEGQLIDFLMATSAMPGFKAAQIDGKTFVDGGLYDNVPFTTAKNRGYRRMIVIDVSAIGIVRKAEIDGTETLYFKNSTELPNILDFSVAAKQKGFHLGELDALKMFGYVSGIRYFYDMDREIMRKLNAILRRQSVIQACRKLICRKRKERDLEDPEVMLRRMLPDHLRVFPDLAQAYMECAALMLGIEIVKRYKLKDFLLELRKRFQEEGQDRTPINVKNILMQLRKINLLHPFYSSREALPPGLLFRLEDHLPVGSISMLIPQFIPARLFHLVLEDYFGN
jgi:NTE family protein